MKKRLFSILLALCRMVCLFAVPASAEEIASGTCGDNLTWVLTDDGTLTISGEGAMEDYYSNYAKEEPLRYAPWYANQMNIKHIVINSGVTTIGDYAFAYCSHLKDVTIADTVHSIGDYAFWYCGKTDTEELEDGGFRQLTIPEGVTEIGAYAFYRSYNLEQVSLPNTLTTAGQYAFGFTNLKSVEIPGSLTVIPEDMFLENRSMKQITLNEGIKRIEDGAFAYCNPSVVVIPSTVEYIGNVAFGWCTPFDRFVVYSTDCVYHEDFYHPYYSDKITDFYSYPDSTRPVLTGDTTLNFHDIPSFTDLPGDSFYFDSVAWALENNITNGATETTFNPGGNCLRAQVVTFLWRAAGEPEPTTTVNPFTDVKETDFFYKPVLWAVEKGITNGISATEFGSYDNCNRAAVVTFLWRAAGSPEPETTVNPFTDVAETDFFYKPVLWAVENGITNGLSATEFGPNASCNRAQVVTFLYRAYN